MPEGIADAGAGSPIELLTAEITQSESSVGSAPPKPILQANQVDTMLTESGWQVRHLERGTNGGSGRASLKRGR